MYLMLMKFILIDNILTQRTRNCTVHRMLVIFYEIFRDVLAAFRTRFCCMFIGNMFVDLRLGQ